MHNICHAIIMHRLYHVFLKPIIHTPDMFIVIHLDRHHRRHHRRHVITLIHHIHLILLIHLAHRRLRMNICAISVHCPNIIIIMGSLRRLLIIRQIIPLVHATPHTTQSHNIITIKPCTIIICMRNQHHVERATYTRRP